MRSTKTKSASKSIDLRTKTPLQIGEPKGAKGNPAAATAKQRKGKKDAARRKRNKGRS